MLFLLPHLLQVSEATLPILLLLLGVLELAVIMGCVQRNPESPDKLCCVA